jgi:excisionase family DNA binding protein
VSDEKKDILNIEEASKLLGVSVKTFNKVLHAECLPGRKIGREWKFSRAALIDWVASGRSVDFYRESSSAADDDNANGNGGVDSITPARRPARTNTDRRTSGWRIELD